MSTFLLRRIITSVLLFWLLLTTLFFLLHLAPGDPASLFENPRSSPQQRARLIELYGLDLPLGQQYLKWLSAVALRGDWGVSFLHRRPVVDVLADAIPNTLLLAAAALVVDLSLGLFFGILAARRRESFWDHGIRMVSLFLYSLPSFWLGLMAILLLSSVLPIFPPSHMMSPGASDLPWFAHFADIAWHLVLPASVLGLTGCGNTIRLIRTSLLEVLGQDYIRTARAKGLPERRVLWVHALRNALGPMVQYFGYSVPLMLNGSLVTEVIFSWPGLGRITFDSILNFDYPLVLAGTALSGLLVILGNLFADLAHGLLDPRVRHG